MKTLAILLILLCGAGAAHAGNGDLIVNGSIGVGTGTVSPAGKLHIHNTGGAANNLVLGEGLGTGEAAASMSFDTTGAGTLSMSVARPGSGAGNIVLQPSAGKVGIGTTSFGTAGQRCLLFGTGSKPSALNGVAGLVAAAINGTTELRAFDEAGNLTTLSAHAGDAPDWLYDLEDGLPMIVREVQYFLGYVRYTNKTRASRLAGMTDAEKQALAPSGRTCVFKESFEEHEARTGEKLARLVWEEEQAAIKQAMDAERQSLLDARTRLNTEIAIKTQTLTTKKGTAKTALQREVDGLRQALATISVPEEYEMKPVPPRIQAALGIR